MTYIYSIFDIHGELNVLKERLNICSANSSSVTQKKLLLKMYCKMSENLWKQRAFVVQFHP